MDLIDLGGDLKRYSVRWTRNNGRVDFGLSLQGQTNVDALSYADALMQWSRTLDSAPGITTLALVNCNYAVMVDNCHTRVYLLTRDFDTVTYKVSDI